MFEIEITHQNLINGLKRVKFLLKTKEQNYILVKISRLNSNLHAII